MNRTCYVTGQKDGLAPYSFGDTVFLPLTQDAFAHFIIRAGRDPAHQRIMEKLKQNYDRGNNVLDRGAECISRDDEEGYVEVQLEAGALDAEKMQLLLEKAQSGVRILRQMKAEFKSEGRLNS